MVKGPSAVGSSSQLRIALRPSPPGRAITEPDAVSPACAWLHNFRRLRPRWERHACMQDALSLECALIC
jgi:hypothetical protein